MSKPLATVKGTMLTPGISRNGRLYTRELIAKAVGRMQERIADPNGLPIVMRTHHEAGDNSALIVGRVTHVNLDEQGNANYKASLYNTQPAKDIAGLVVGDQPALKSVSIHGYWLGDPRKVKYQGETAVTADDLEIDAVDFTASPGVSGAVVTQASYYTEDAATTESVNGRVAISESAEVELLAITETAKPAVAEGNIMVCVSDDYGNEIVRVNAANVDRKTLKAAGKKALKLARRIVDKNDDDAIDFDGDDADDQMQADTGQPDSDPVGGGADDVKGVTTLAKPAVPDAKAQKATNPAFVVGPGSDPQAPQRSFENVKVFLDGKDVTEKVTMRGEWVDITNTVTVYTKTSGVTTPETDASTVDAHESEESAVPDDKKAVEQAAPSGLTEADITRLGALIGESIKQAMTAMAEKADAKAAKKAAKESKKNDTETKATETAEPTKAAVVEVKESGISAAELEEKLTAERVRIKDELRESILKESGLPSRKGYRHVAESDTDVTPTGDELWDRRSEVWGQLLNFGQSTVVPVAADSTES